MIRTVLLRAALLLALLTLSAPALADQSDLCFPLTGVLTGLDLVTDLNGALKALETHNLGTSAPANDCTGAPVQGEIWIDSSGSVPVAKWYDGTSWIVLGTLDSVSHVWTSPIGGGATSLASASTTDLWSVPQSLVTITGTTTIDKLAGSGAVVGTEKSVIFSGALQLTYSGTQLILPTGHNITTAAGDVARVVALGGGNVRVTDYSRANGTSLALPNPSSSTLGGIQSIAAVSHQWLNAISTSGVPSASQPSFSDISGTLGATAGGTGLGSYSTGDLLYASAPNTLLNLGVGTTGQVLTVVGGKPAWATPATSGGMTLLGTVTTVGSSPQGLTGLTVTSCKALYLNFNNVSISAVSTVGLELGSGGSPSYGSAVVITGTNSTGGIDGGVWVYGINATTQQQSVEPSVVTSGSLFNTGHTIATGSAAAVDAVRFIAGGGGATFLTGTIDVYCVS